MDRALVSYVKVTNYVETYFSVVKTPQKAMDIWPIFNVVVHRLA